MCGIVGVVSRRPQDRDWLSDAVAALKHRGPDDARVWWAGDGCAGLGHTRLSIIDLSTAASQPMHSHDQRHSIVFNGEIYNFRELARVLAGLGHRFVSDSDTEVLLAAWRQWGAGCLDRLVGMFAFAIYDRVEQVLIAARDRAGEKPLFYRHERHRFSFASELKGLFADPSLPRRIDPDALDEYLAFGYVPAEQCIIQGVNKLPPAHALRFSARTGELTCWRYWDLPPEPDPVDLAGIDEHALLDEFEALLENAVGQQLHADVPLGVLLSGGVDSSLIAAMAVRRSPRVKTFTLGLPGHAGFDESAHARLVARHLGTEHHELQVQEPGFSLLPKLARQFDEPMADASMIPTWLITRLIREHCKVAVGGDGGDELFGGYPHHSAQLRMARLTRRVPAAARCRLAGLAAAIVPASVRGHGLVQKLAVDYRNSLMPTTGLFRPSERRALLDSPLAASLPAELAWEQRLPKAGDLLQRATRHDFGSYLADDLLVKVDRASMLNSLEVRAPILDHRVVEFAFSRVPQALRATETARKILPKRLTERVLPDEFDRVRKQGFSIPYETWIRSGEWGAAFASVLLADRNDSPLRKEPIQLLFRQMKGGRNHAPRLFALLMLELWRREYAVAF